MTPGLFASRTRLPGSLALVIAVVVLCGLLLLRQFGDLRLGVREDDIPESFRPPPLRRQSAAPQFPAATGDFRFGINEGVAVPAKQRTGGIASIEAELKADAALVTGLGASIVRAHTGAFPPVSYAGLRLQASGRPGTPPAAAAVSDPIALADAWVMAVGAAGLEGVMMVSPWPGNASAEAAIRAGSGYVPHDLAAYAAYVGALVERYDGDGVDDLPGLIQPIRYWEVDNEPDLKNTLPPKGNHGFDPSGFCTPAEYAQVLLTSAAAIRQASADARVLVGGFYRPHADVGEAYIRGVVAVPGVLESFDLVSIHTYSDDPAGELLAESLVVARRLMPGKPVWVTETNAASSGKKDYLDEEFQARMVATLHARAILGGATALFWHSLVEPPTAAELNTLHQGSLYRLGSGGELGEKRAVGVYRRLAARLRPLTVAGARLETTGLLRFGDGSALLFDGELKLAGAGEDLLTGEVLSVGDRARAPAWIMAAPPG